MGNRGKSAKILAPALIVVLALATIVPVIAVLMPLTSAQAAAEWNAYLKLVTPAWKGTNDTSKSYDDWYESGWYLPPVFPTGTTWVERYNLTKIDSNGDPTLESNVVVGVYYVTKSNPNPSPYKTFTPNGTGFVQISWPKDWPNVTIAVKAKGWYGDKIGTDKLFSGIILAMITVNPTESWYKQFGAIGMSDTNATLSMAGTWVDATTSHDGSNFFDFRKNGPVALLSMTPGNFSYYNAPERAFVTVCAVTWLKFHTHTWYSLKDNLSYAQIRVFDLNYSNHGASATSPASLVGAAVTVGANGQSKWVPIPLQTMHLGLKKPFNNKFTTGANKAPHLNATARVWWETVLVGEINYTYANTNLVVSTNPDNIDSIKIYRGPLNGTDAPKGWNGTLSHINCTVFYAKFRANDSDPRVKHSTFGDALADAQVLIILTRKLPTSAAPYEEYFNKEEIGITNSTGYTAAVDGPSMVGALPVFKNGGFMRFPNATKPDYPVVYNPADAENKNEALQRPCTKIVKISYVNTISLDDDLSKGGEFKGIVVQVRWKGGPAGAYGGDFVPVNSTYIANPYAIALKNVSWTSVKTTANTLIKIKNSEFKGDILLIECTVYDLMLQIVDKLGAPLEPANTKVVLFRPNGPPVEFAGLPTEHTVALLNGSRIYNIVFYDWISANGTLLVYQLPGELGPYGVQVYYQGVLVYENLTLVPKLVKTENFTLVTNVVKVMVKITDAHDAGLARTPVFYKHPVYGTIMTLTGDEGVIDFGRIPAPELKFLSVYWKGVNVKFFEIKYPDGTVQPAEPDGTAIIKTANATSLPIIVRAKITDIIFYTWDFQKVEKIPRVNITMSWWGLNITTGKMVKFVETMDGNDGKPWDVEFDKQCYNTSKIVAQFFSYRITYYSDEGKAIFHQMPALDEDLNKPEINVTTATRAWKWTGAIYGGVPLPEEYVTPGSALWNYTHGRLVLRVLPKSYNPDVYYPDILAALNFKNITFCRRITIDLPLWAMGFKVVAINGERWLDGAEFSIKNDEGIMMEIVKSNATEPILYVSRVDEDNPLLSKIWWNGTYTCEDLYFKTDMGVVVDMFTWYRPGGTWPQNIAPWPDYVADNYTFILTPDIDLKNAWKTKTSTVKVLNLIETTAEVTYYVPYIYDKELLKVPLPVGFITLELKDQGGVRPIKYAFVNITAHTNQTGYPVYNLAGYGKAQWAGKTDAEGKAEIIAPTAGFLNYTLKKANVGVIKYFNITVYWYLNSSVVYEAYFNLTKMGWKVDKVAVSDVVLRHTVCSDWNRPVKGLYADLAWVNVTAPNTYVHPGRLVANDTAKTWILEPLNETMGKAPWVDGELELNLVPTAMHYKVYDYFVNDYVEWNVSHLWRVAAWYTGLQKGPVQAPDGKSYKQLMYGSGTDKSPVSSAVYVIIGAAPFDHTTYTYMPGTTNKGLLVSYDVVSGITKKEVTSMDDNNIAPSNIGKIGPYTVTKELPLIKYLEPAKTTEIIEATRTVKHVALKLNATDIAVRVVWQQGENATATYVTGPLVGWTVKLTFVPPAEYLTDAEREALWTAWKKTFVVTTDETGTAWIRSGSTPDTVIWNASRIKAGMTKDTSWLVVSPPAYMLNEKDPYWLNNVVKPGAEAHGLSVFEGTQDPSAMVGVDLTPEGYFAWLPDPSLWVKDPYEGAKSKIYDLYGLPVELEVQNEWGAGLWLPSYFGGVNGSGWSRIGGAWYARINVWPNDPKTSQHVPFSPIFQYMPVTARILDFNGRPLPGAFLWMIDSVTGKTAGWSYAGKDGVTETVYLRKPEWTLLLRVSYLGRDADGKPAWPFNAFGKWPVSYYSDADETQPGPGIFGELAKRVKVTTLAHEYHGVWRIRPGAHWDITARIFDIKIRHYYATSKPIEVDATFYREFPDKPGGIVEFKAKEVIEVNRLNRGTYEDVAKWLGVTVGRKSFDLSAANVGTVAGELEVAVGDMSVAVKDLNGRLLSDAIAKFEGVEQKLTIPSEILAKYKLASEDDAKSLKAVGAVFVTKLPIPTNIRYSLDISWTSPDFGTEAKVSIVDTVDGINAKKEIVLPVGAVTINVVDGKGRAVSGAEVSLGAVKAKTDAAGKAVFESVPLEKEGRGITYQITVTREGEEVFKDTVTFSTTKTSITVIGELFDLTVFVKGAAGQGLPFATVTLKKAGVVVGHFTTDEGGSVTIPKLVAADYEVEATYKGYTGTVKVSKADLIAGKSAEITLPPYIEIAGMPLTFATFLALIIGIILLIIVVVVIAFEYVRWRGRRVGIFPPPPPKK